MMRCSYHYGKFFGSLQSLLKGRNTCMNSNAIISNNNKYSANCDRLLPISIRSMKTTSGEEKKQFTLAEIVVGGCLALLIVPTYIVDLMKVDGPTMMPLFKSKGDIILVDKISHRFFGIARGDQVECARFYKHQQRKLPQKAEKYNYFLREDETHENTTRKKEINRSSSFSTFQPRGLSYGDVVIVKHPNPLFPVTICNRIVALPGDILYFKNKRNRFRVYIVPEGHLWVEADNKGFRTVDSRSHGPVPASLVVGKVVLRMWPLRGDAIVRRY